MRFAKSLISTIAAMTLATGAAFAGNSTSYESGGPELLAGPELQAESSSYDSLEAGDRDYFAQSEAEGAMTDPITSANSGQMMEYDVYYIVPVEVVEVEEIWLIPSGDSEMPHG